MAKKAEGRPVMPEEYQVLSQFVDRVERGLIRQREKELMAEEERQKIAQAVVPEAAYDIPLEEIGIPLRYTTILGGAGFPTLGDLMLQLSLDQDVILALDGIGPKAMKDIDEALEKYSYLFPAAEAEAEVVPEAPQEVELLTPEEIVAEPIVVSEEGEVSAEALEAEEIPLAEGETMVVELAEGVSEPVAAIEAEPLAEEIGEVQATDLDQLFTLPTDVLEMVAPLAEEESEDEDQQKKKKKKKKFVQMEYDPDKDVVVYKKKPKRSGPEGWDGGWE
jgi:N utilization substance protein A